MNKYLIRLALVMLTLFSFGCDYETDKDYFVEKDKPSSGTHLNINIRDVGQDGIIYIYTTTTLDYSIEAGNQQLLEVSFLLDGQNVSAYNNMIILTPTSEDEKEHALKVIVKLKSNTGSLADRLYLEKYTGEFSYKVRFLKADFKLNISQEIVSDGYLKLSWDDPALEQTPVEKYNISYYDIVSGKEKSYDIENPQNTFFIDDDYIYGLREYRIKTYFKNNKIQPWTDFFIADYEVLTADNIGLNLRQQRSSEGFLELIWDKPNVRKMPVVGYRIEYYDEQLGGLQTKDISEFEPKSFIDENYAYGDREYRFTVFLYNDRFKFTKEYIPVYKKITKKDFVIEGIGLETIRISWPAPDFKCTQIVRLFDDKNILIPEGVNSIEIDRPPFPDLSWLWSNYNMIQLHLVGKKTQYDLNYHPSFYHQGSEGVNYFYDRFPIEDDILSYVTYPNGNLLYVLARRGIYSVDMKTMKVTKCLEFDETISLSMSCDQNSSKVVVRNSNKISIYKDHSFTNPIQFELGYAVHPMYEILKFTPDNKLFISSNMSAMNNYNIALMAFDSNTGKYLYDIPLPTSGKDIRQMRLSDDNKYMMLELIKIQDDTSTQVDILELNGTQTKLLKTYTYDDLMTGGSSFYFNSSNPTRLIRQSNKFQVLELPSFNKIAEVEGGFSSVDSGNGNLVYLTSDKRYQYVNIMDSYSFKPLFKWRMDGGMQVYNNVLISTAMHSWGTYFDISKFMKKTY